MCNNSTARCSGPRCASSPSLSRPSKVMLCLAPPIAFSKWSTSFRQSTYWRVDDCLYGLHFIKSSTTLCWKIHCTKEGGPHVDTAEMIGSEDAMCASSAPEFPCLGSFYLKESYATQVERETRVQKYRRPNFCSGRFEIWDWQLLHPISLGISVLICKESIGWNNLWISFYFYNSESVWFLLLKFFTLLSDKNSFVAIIILLH